MKATECNLNGLAISQKEAVRILGGSRLLFNKARSAGKISPVVLGSRGRASLYDVGEVCSFWNNLRQSRNRGFTLVEVLGTVLVVGTLALAAVPAIQLGQCHRLETAAKKEQQNINSAFQSYLAAGGAVPSASAGAEEVVQLLQEPVNGIGPFLMGPPHGYRNCNGEDMPLVFDGQLFAYGGLGSAGGSAGGGAQGGGTEATPSPSPTPEQLMPLKLSGNGNNQNSSPNLHYYVVAIGNPNDIPITGDFQINLPSGINFAVAGTVEDPQRTWADWRQSVGPQTIYQGGAGIAISSPNWSGTVPAKGQVVLEFALLATVGGSYQIPYTLASDPSAGEYLINPSVSLAITASFNIPVSLKVAGVNFSGLRMAGITPATASPLASQQAVSFLPNPWLPALGPYPRIVSGTAHYSADGTVSRIVAEGQEFSR